MAISLWIIGLAVSDVINKKSRLAYTNRPGKRIHEDFLLKNSFLKFIKDVYKNNPKSNY